MFISGLPVQPREQPERIIVSALAESKLCVQRLVAICRPLPGYRPLSRRRRGTQSPQTLRSRSAGPPPGCVQKTPPGPRHPQTSRLASGAILRLSARGARYPSPEGAAARSGSPRARRVCAVTCLFCHHVLSGACGVEPVARVGRHARGEHLFGLHSFGCVLRVGRAPTLVRAVPLDLRHGRAAA